MGIWIEVVNAHFSFDVGVLLAVIFAYMVKMPEIQRAKQLGHLIFICAYAWELRLVRNGRI